MRNRHQTQSGKVNGTQREGVFSFVCPLSVGHLPLSVFFVCVMCLVSFSRGYAQQVVEVESDIMSGAVSENDLEKMQEDMTAELKVVKEFKKGDEQQDLPPADDPAVEEMDPGKPGGAGKEEDVLQKELLEAEIEAAQVDVLSEDEILKINKSLKRAIQQNRLLQDEKQRLDEELRVLRGQERIKESRVQVMQEKVADYEKRIENADTTKKELNQKVEKLQGEIKSREKALQERIDDLQKELTQRTQKKVSDAKAVGSGDMTETDVAAALPGAPEQEQMTPAGEEKILQTQKDGLDVIDLLDEMDTMRQQMHSDEAKVHYNMGNIFFHQGKYDEAVAEYEKTLEILPSDASAHFNLAYVSAEYLHEYEKAVQHYKQYLFLNPQAEDSALVKEKIIEAQLLLRTRMNIDGDKEVHGNKPLRSYTW